MGDELRERMLGSGPRQTPEEAERNQRERLFGAVVAACAEQGYEATTIGDLIAVAGVSRRDFYRHFDGKEAVFLATLEEILRGVTRAALARVREHGTWRERAEAALAAVAEMAVDQPAAARLCLVEAHAAGPAAVERLEGAIAGFQSIAERAFEEDPERAGMPAEITRALVGGFGQMLQARLLRGTEAELVTLVPILLELDFSYLPPPRPLRTRPRRRGGERVGPPASAWAREALAEDPAERIVLATIATVAAKGFQATTIGEIADVAEVSLSTFYAHFDGKEEAFDAALYSGRTRLIGVAMPPFKRARSWPESIRALTRSSYAFLAGETDFARAVTLGVLGTGPAALERHMLAHEAAHWPFAEGRAQVAPELPEIAVEATNSACYALMCEWIARRGPETLLEAEPMATYLALVPFIGAEAACEVANGGRWEGGSASVGT
jgi:AcrR family transcriptional regulator